MVITRNHLQRMRPQANNCKAQSLKSKSMLCEELVTFIFQPAALKEVIYSTDLVVKTPDISVEILLLQLQEQPFFSALQQCILQQKQQTCKQQLTPSYKCNGVRGVQQVYPSWSRIMLLHNIAKLLCNSEV